LLSKDIGVDRDVKMQIHSAVFFLFRAAVVFFRRLVLFSRLLALSDVSNADSDPLTWLFKRFNKKNLY